MEGEERMDLENQADKLHEKGLLFGEDFLEEDDADDCDDIDYDDDSLDEEETATPAEPVVDWEPSPVPVEEQDPRRRRWARSWPCGWPMALRSVPSQQRTVSVAKQRQ